jgi:hypothetical protein
LVCDAAFWKEIKALNSHEQKMDKLEQRLLDACPPLNTVESLMEDMRGMKCDKGLTAYTVAFAKKAHLYLKLLRPVKGPNGAEEGEIPQDEVERIQLKLPEWADAKSLNSLAKSSSNPKHICPRC